MAQTISDCVIINGIILTGYFSLSPLFHFLKKYYRYDFFICATVTTANEERHRIAIYKAIWL